MALKPRAGREYAFGPVVRLRVGGSALARAHFDCEYGPAMAARGSPDVEADVRFGWRPTRRHAGLEAVGGHKTVRWRVGLSDPRERPLRARVAVTGGPPSFALSLVQGYYVEPLVGVALARAGFMALPSAAVVDRDGAVVIIGRSRSGKSSVSVRALAEGRTILGDDQIVIASDGGCWPYPRRLRLYPDIENTAPEAWLRLRRSTRSALRLRRFVRWSTGGYVAPSLAVRTSELHTSGAQGRLPAARLLLVERSADVRALTEDRRNVEWAMTEIRDVVAEQRLRLSSAADPVWSAALHDVAELEAAILRAWLERLAVAHLRIPRAWDAPTAVGALAERVGID
jgi:hypothetical protein